MKNKSIIACWCPRACPVHDISSSPKESWEEEFDEKFGTQKTLRFDRVGETVTVYDNTDYKEIKWFIQSELDAYRNSVIEEVLEKFPKEKEIERGYDDYPKMKSLEDVGFNQALSEVKEKLKTLNK